MFRVCRAETEILVRFARVYWLAVALAVVAFASCEEASSRGEMGRFLTPNGTLTETLELKDAQEGFAGVSGEILTVEPDGTWRVARFLNDRVEAPHRQGQLSPEELKSLAEALAEQDFGELPSTVGEAPAINPHRIIVRFGEVDSTLLLEPGQDVSGSAAPRTGQASGPQARLAAVVRTVRGLVDD